MGSSMDFKGDTDTLRLKDDVDVIVYSPTAWLTKSVAGQLYDTLQGAMDTNKEVYRCSNQGSYKEYYSIDTDPDYVPGTTLTDHMRKVNEAYAYVGENIVPGARERAKDISMYAAHARQALHNVTRMSPEMIKQEYGETPTVETVLKEVYESYRAGDEGYAGRFDEEGSPYFDGQKSMQVLNSELGVFAPGVKLDDVVTPDIFRANQPMKIHLTDVAEAVFYSTTLNGKSAEEKQILRGVDPALVKEALDDAKALSPVWAAFNGLIKEVMEGDPKYAVTSPASRDLWQKVFKVYSKKLGLQGKILEDSYDLLFAELRDTTGKLREAIELWPEAKEGEGQAEAARTRAEAKIAKMMKTGEGITGQNLDFNDIVARVKGEAGKTFEITAGGDIRLRGKQVKEYETSQQLSRVTATYENLLNLLNYVDHVAEPYYSGDPKSMLPQDTVRAGETLQQFADAQRNHQNWWFGDTKESPLDQPKAGEALQSTYDKSLEITDSPLAADRVKESGEAYTQEVKIFGKDFKLPKIHHNHLRKILPSGVWKTLDSITDENNRPNETSVVRTGDTVKDQMLAKKVEEDLSNLDFIVNTIRETQGKANMIELMGIRTAEAFEKSARDIGVTTKDFNNPEYMEPILRAIQEIFIPDHNKPTVVGQTQHGLISGMEYWKTLSPTQKALALKLKNFFDSIAIDKVALGMMNPSIVDNMKVLGWDPRFFLEPSMGAIKAGDRGKRKHPLRAEYVKSLDGKKRLEINPVNIMHRMTVQFAGQTMARELLTKLSMNQLGIDANYAGDGQPLLFTTDGKVAYIGDWSQKKMKEMGRKLSYKSLKESKDYIRLSHPLKDTGEKTWLANFNFWKDGQYRETYVHKDVYDELSKQLKLAFGVSGIKEMSRARKIVGGVARTTKFAALWNVVYPGFQMLNSYVMGTTPVPGLFKGGVRWAAPLTMGVTTPIHALRSLPTMGRAIARGVGDMSPVGAGIFGGMMAGGMTLKSLPGANLPVIGKVLGAGGALAGGITGALAGKAVQLFAGAKGDIPIKEILPFMDRGRSRGSIEMEMARYNYQASTTRQMMSQIMDSFQDSKAQKFMKNLFFDKWGLSRGLWTMARDLSAECYIYNKGLLIKQAQEKGVHMSPEEAGKLAAYFTTYAFGFPEEKLMFKADDMLKYFMSARNSFFAWAKQQTGQFEGAYRGGGVHRSGLWGHRGFDREQAKALSSLFIRQSTGQLYFMAMQAAILTKLIADYWPWEREEELFPGLAEKTGIRIPDPYKLLDIGTGVKGMSGEERTIVTPWGKDARDQMQMLSALEMFSRKGNGVPRWIKNKAAFYITPVLEMTGSVDEFGLPVGAPIEDKVVRALEDTFEQFTPAGAFGETGYSQRLSALERRAAVMGFRTRGAPGGVGPESRRWLENKRREQGAKYETFKQGEDLEQAWNRGDWEAIRRIVRERGWQPEQLEDYILRKRNPRAYQYQKTPKKIRGRFR